MNNPKNRLRVVLLLVLIFSGVVVLDARVGSGAPLVPDSPHAEALHLENSALASRRAIRNGRLELVVARQYTRDESQLSVSRRFIVFDGPKRRIEVNPLVLPAAAAAIDGDPEQGRSGRSIVVTPEYLIEYRRGLTRNGKHYAVRFLRNTEKEKDPYDAELDELSYDPLCIGMLPESLGTLNYFSLDSLLGSTDREESSVTETTYGQHKTRLVENKRRNGNLIRYWIVPEMDYGVVRCETVATHLGETFSDITESELTRFEEGGVWFPHTVTHRRIIWDDDIQGEGTVVFKEVVEVQSARFNYDVDQTAFTLAGMDVPPGRDVLHLPPHPEHLNFWDGKTLVRGRPFNTRAEQ